MCAVGVIAAGFGALRDRAVVAAADAAPAGRFVWHDLMTRDMSASKRFYGDLFGWRFEDAKKRGEFPYVIARAGSMPVGGIVDITSSADGSSQWLSYMAVADVDKAAEMVRAAGGKILITPRNREPIARIAVVADPQGGLFGVAQLKQSIPEPAQPTAGHFFWQEYLAREAAPALDFYKRLAGYQSTVSDSRLGVEYHVLRTNRGQAGLFQLPATTDVQPNWLPYVLVNDPASLAARVTGLGGRILVPAAPERRNGSLVVIADPGGAPLALQKFPF